MVFLRARILHIILVLVAGILAGCANMVTPTGGPKDVTPPRVTEAKPENRSVNFIGKKIEITFDEYVTLENANQNVLVSPPLTNKPDIKLNNKTLVIRFKEELKPNTTYTIDFGAAVKDLHEGNVFKDYRYTFSTGEVLDSLSIAGVVLDAETKKPVEDMQVSLYDCESDSLFDQPTRRAPDYIAKTDKEGKFRVNGLPDKSFLVFALKDVNSNLYYDMPNEMVAFLDTCCRTYSLKEVPTPLDTIPQDTIPLDTIPLDTIPLDTIPLDTILQDSIPKDSILMDTLPKLPPQPIRIETSVTLYAFTEIDTNQMVLEKKLVSEGVLRFVFRHPTHGVTVEAPALSGPSTPDSLILIKVWSPTNDTLWWYFTPNLLDTLRVNITYDTLINESILLDLHYRETNTKASKALKVSPNINKGVIVAKECLILRFAEPVTHLLWHDSSALVANDSVLIDSFNFEKADEAGLQYRLLPPLNDSSSYSLRLTDSVFCGVTGRTNDSLDFKFRRATEKDLGNIFITVVPPEGRQVVLELLNASDKLVRTQVVDTVQRVGFLNLLPEKYKLRAIIDNDRNGKWSTGNFHLLFHPETVIDYKDPLEIKAGWDIDLEDSWVVQP